MPRITHYGRLVAFFGHDPMGSVNDGDLPGRLRSFRRLQGLTQVAAARLLGIDPKTWWEWEMGRRLPSHRGGQALGQLLASRLADRE